MAQLRNQFLAAAAQSTTFATALANDGKILGQILGKDPTGHTVVKTDAGMVVVKLPPAIVLPQGSTATLLLSGTPKAILAQLVQLAPPPSQTAPPPQIARPPVPEAPVAQIAQAVQTRPAPLLTATVIVAAPAQPGANQPALAAGATVQLRVPAPTTPPAATTLAPQTNPATAVALPAPAANTQAAAQPPPAAATAAAPQAPQRMEVRVLAQLPGGQTLLDTPIGRLAAVWPPGLPRPAEGAKLALEVPTARPPAGNTAGADALKSNVPLAREWPALKEAFKSLADASPALARRVLDEAIPRPGPKLAIQIMSYLAADRTDARSLLGETVATALERSGRSDILQRLDGDLKEMQRQAAVPTDWRVAYVPFQDGGELRQLRIFSRREQSKDKKDRDSKRFVVEVAFSELGDVQIDGLMRKPKLELMLRTHRQIPPDLRDEIEVVFLEGCTLAGLAGRIYFQAGERFPVNPIEEIAQQTQGVVA
ncbi:MAG: hypothetical protein ING44_05510 [Telmatospirillum sp.]|nr:hypothetical protein [Telmatospirillum sp.]